jgi:formate dehydrogenase maturation protein FdhE
MHWGFLSAERVRGAAMDCDPVVCAGNKAQDNNDIFCPRCAIRPMLVIVMLDSRKGKTIRVFRCQCGEMLWDD